MSEKPQLVLLPGLLCDEALWQFQMEALSDAARITVADLTKADSVAGMAAGVLGQIQGDFALAGHSMGGYVAHEIMRQAPQRVTRLALIATSARADTPETVERRKALIDLAQKGRFKGVTPRLLPSLLHKDHQHPPLSTIVIDMAARVGQAAFVRQQTAILTRPDSRPGLAVVRVPTLVVAGEADQLTPVELHEEMADLIPTAEFQIIAKSGHLPMLEQPDTLNRALFDWLTS
jgi:pimeloyl-ACP methyl ester carboxylesterase